MASTKFLMLTDNVECCWSTQYNVYLAIVLLQSDCCYVLGDINPNNNNSVYIFSSTAFLPQVTNRNVMKKAHCHEIHEMLVMAS